MSRSFSLRLFMHRSILFAALLIPALSSAQQPTLSPGVRQFVSVEGPVIALRGVRLIDGTGTPARDNQTIVIEGTQIKAVGPAGSTQIPANARVLDLTGHTVIPG